MRRLAVPAVLAGGLVMTLFSAPAEADHHTYPYYNKYSFSNLGYTHYNLCQPGGVFNEPPVHSFSWEPKGDWVFIRDCKGDGYSARIRVYYSDCAGDHKAYAGIYHIDPSAEGDGGWFNHDVSESRAPCVTVKAWANRGATQNDVVWKTFRI